MEFKEIGTKNVRHLWSVLCNSSILDAGTENLTINNLIEQVTINVGKEMVEKKEADKSGGYMIPVQMHIVTKLKKNDPNKDVSLEIKFEEINPAGKVLNSSTSQKFEIKRPFKNLRLRNNYSPLLVDQSGEYTIRVLLKESDDDQFTEVDRIPFEVSLAEAKKLEDSM